MADTSFRRETISAETPREHAEHARRYWRHAESYVTQTCGQTVLYFGGSDALDPTQPSLFHLHVGERRITLEVLESGYCAGLEQRQGLAYVRVMGSENETFEMPADLLPTIAQALKAWSREYGEVRFVERYPVAQRSLSSMYPPSPPSDATPSEYLKALKPIAVLGVIGLLALVLSTYRR